MKKFIFKLSYPIVCLLVLLIFGLLYLPNIQKESTYSETENRLLAGAPDPVSSVRNGTLDSDIETYLLDRFPGRDRIIARAKSLKDVMSIATYEDYLLANNGSVDPLDSGSEEIDIEELLAELNKPTPTPEPIPTEAPVVTDVPEDLLPTPTPEPVLVENPPIEPKPAPNASDFKSTLQTYMMVGNSKSVFTASKKEKVLAFTAVINKYAALLPKDGKLMLTVVPQAAYANQFVRAKQRSEMVSESIALINAFGADNVYAFDAAAILGEAICRGEYVFFRTDMHWTPLGSYYLYREMIARAGSEPSDYETDYVHYTEAPFLGTYYRDNPSASLKQNADTLELLEPAFPHELRRIDGPDSYHVIPYLNQNARSNDRYTVYLGGPAGPWTYVECDNGCEENALVIMDSFGLGYFTFLTNHYKQVHYYDPRYFDKKKVGYSVSEMIARYNITDIYVVLGDLHSYDASFFTVDANKQLN